MNSTISSATARSPPATKNPHKAGKTVKKANRKKPQDKPKRPLSAYNYFFQHERRLAILAKQQNKGDSNLHEDAEKKLQESINGKRRRRHRRTSGLGFASLAQSVAEKWRAITDDDREVFQKLAENDKIRYEKEMAQWNKKQLWDLCMRDSDFSFVPSYAAPTESFQAIPCVPVPATSEVSYPSMSLSESLASTESILTEAKAVLQRIQQEQDMPVYGNSGEFNDSQHMALSPLNEVTSLQSLSVGNSCHGSMNCNTTEYDEVANDSIDPMPLENYDNCGDELFDDAFLKLLEECDF